MKNKLSSFLMGLAFLQQLKPLPVQAAVVTNQQTAEKINELMDGPLATLITIAIAFLVVTVVVAFIFQLVRLSFNPDMPVIRRDIFNNIAGLSGILVAVGFFSTVGFAWFMNLMRKGGSEIGGEVLKEGEISISKWAMLLNEYKGYALIFFGFATLTMVTAFIVQITKLAATAGNPAARQKAIMGILWTGISAALLGSLTIILTILVSSGKVPN